ncbi:DUF3558 domain-containing protein [Prescottella sp. R16]|uniref:DUF3558 domain-containing protein n=1 Tax=Prescottella sp. R16 TaxID=3064529 RepID=UPI00272E6B90|nr:DUF3558 domain-containing protein [Prescottella sp. R16]
MRGTVVVAAIGAALLLAGCGAGSVTGRADAEGTVAGEPAFSPCDDIPDSALIELGLDPGKADRDFSGVQYPGWNRCRWPGSDHSVSVLAGTQSVDEIRRGSNAVDVADHDLDGRAVLTYRDPGDVRRERCNVAIRAGDGTAIVRVSVYNVDAGPEPCSTALQAAATLSPSIPE